jgi:hypothetical protein
MGQIHEDPQAIALPHHLQTEGVQSQVVVIQDSGAGIGPGGGERVSHLQAAESQPAVDAKAGQVLDHDATVHAQHEGQLAFRTEAFQIIRCESQTHLRVGSGRLVDGVHFQQETLDGVGASEDTSSQDMPRLGGGVDVRSEVSHDERLGDRPDAQDGDVDPIRQQGRRIEGGLRLLGEAEESRRDRRVDDDVLLENFGDRVRLRGIGSGTGAGCAQQQAGQRGPKRGGKWVCTCRHG